MHQGRTQHISKGGSRSEVTWRMEHLRYFFSSRMEHADSCIQQLIDLCHHHTITLPPPAEPYKPKPNVQTLPAEPNRTKSQPNPPKRNEPRREPNTKLAQCFPFRGALYITAPQRSPCNLANNGGYKPTLGPFAFKRKKNIANVPFAKSLHSRKNLDLALRSEFIKFWW